MILVQDIEDFLSNRFPERKNEVMETVRQRADFISESILDQILTADEMSAYHAQSETNHAKNLAAINYGPPG